MKLFPRLLVPPKQSFLLLGARGTGKSTWLRSSVDSAAYVDLLDEARFQDYLASPGLFAAELRSIAPESWIVVDEIQRLPNLLIEVHRLIEERGIRFALCGSSARKLRRAGVNLLAGRALPRRMFPFVPEEMGGAFSLSEALECGTLPVVFRAPEPVETLRAYAQLYLREEIQAEAHVRNLPGFARFLPIAALFHGQVLNVASLARDAGVARTTVTSYLEVLEDTLVAFRLPPFEGRLRVRERKHPKLYWIDPGLVRALKKSAGPVTPEERGPLFEGFVAHVLRAYGEHADLFDDLACWASTDRPATEVDFLLKRGEDYLAIEAKSGPRISETLFKGLRAIAPLPGLRRRILVYPGERCLTTEDGIEVLGFTTFADEISAGTVWPASAS